MINQQLLDYVRAQRTSGLSKEAITQALAAGGWTPNDVNEAFMAIEGVRTPPAAPPIGQSSSAGAPQPIQPVQPRTIIPPPGAQPQQAARPIVSASEFSTAPVMMKRRHRIWPWI